jgi:Icc-related predicted phosphoesterase
MTKEHRFAFGTDFHGNMKSVDRFLEVAREKKVDHVIFGGDLTPKKMAVKLSDGTGVRIGGRGYSKIPEMDMAQSAELLENGYILFKSELTRQELEAHIAIAKKCEAVISPQCTVGSRHHAVDSEVPDLDGKELEFFRTYFVPWLRNFLKNNEQGRRIFGLFASQIKLYCTDKLNLDPDYFSESLYMMLYANMLVKNRELENMDRSLINRSFAVRAINLKAIWENMLMLVPWRAWEEKKDNLHLYALPGQRRFLHKFLRRVAEFRKAYRGTVSVIVGNDDDSEMIRDLNKANRQGIISHASNKVVALDPEVTMVGYSYVPHVPGVKYDEWFRPEAFIQADLFDLFKEARGRARYVLANIHCPPVNTNLDQARVPDLAQNNFGSHGVRAAIEFFKPAVSLHGHVHGSYKVSNSVRDQIGPTVLYNPGASEYGFRGVISSLADPEVYEVIDL